MRVECALNAPLQCPECAPIYPECAPSVLNARCIQDAATVHSAHSKDDPNVHSPRIGIRPVCIQERGPFHAAQLCPGTEPTPRVTGPVTPLRSELARAGARRSPRSRTGGGRGVSNPHVRRSSKQNVAPLMLHQPANKGEYTGLYIKIGLGPQGRCTTSTCPGPTGLLWRHQT